VGFLGQDGFKKKKTHTHKIFGWVLSLGTLLDTHVLFIWFWGQDKWIAMQCEPAKYVVSCYVTEALS
jgi:hypothetical protein